MKTDTPKTIYLKDYKPYPFKIHSINLNFDIHEGHTIVTANAEYERLNPAAKDVFLNGEDLELISVKIDGAPSHNFTQNEDSLRIPTPSDRFSLEIVTKIKPEDNTRLEGLYMSGGNYCTQCEAEGFRRITYYPDRPDVLSVFTVRVEADVQYPVLLSNGNVVEIGKCGDGRHYAIWHDPFPKPCYLFALVAGDLARIQDQFVTKSGREVDLFIYVRAGDEGQCGHAMDSLKRAMKWDEDAYGLEYELEVFNIVAVSDFNMGAMENTSLNIFNTALVLAHQETATDTDYGRVESVIAHEYFHNWSGNRVTCRDWFQLSLKEGLTVFRDQEFSADMGARDVQRIDDVMHLRRLQFPEDAGPLSHPIRPDNYIEINNFYTMTVYEKGAEVIRMMRTILGAENYRKGTDLYFSRHDGTAATCDDFVTCMSEASGVDLSQFKLWYSTAGTPKVSFKGIYDEAKKTYTVSLAQSFKNPLHIPVPVGLLDVHGGDIIGTRVLHLKDVKQDFVFENIPARPVPSVLRGFSAPVKLSVAYHDEDADLRFLMMHDSDGFNRWEAGQTYFLNALGFMLENENEVPECFLETYGALIESALNEGSDKGFMARMLSLPSIQMIGQQQEAIDPSAIHSARQKALAAIKRMHKPALQRLYDDNQLNGSFSISQDAIGQRALKNQALSLLTATYGTGCAKMARAHYFNANNMTDRVAALTAIAPNKNPARAEVFNDFYARFKDYPLVVDKYFSLQASAAQDDIIQNLKKLREHTDFNIKNPNRVRSLYAAFAMNNPVGFHAVDGSGYDFLTDGIIELNSINPQIAARLLTPLRDWKRYTPDRQVKMKAALERILSQPKLSPDVFEIASKSLKG